MVRASSLKNVRAIRSIFVSAIFTFQHIDKLWSFPGRSVLVRTSCRLRLRKPMLVVPLFIKNSRIDVERMRSFYVRPRIGYQI